MDIIPNELVEYILDYLGRKSLVRCLLVNHLWNIIANYLMKKIRLEFGFRKIIKFHFPNMINITDDYIFYVSSYNVNRSYEISKFNLLTGKNEMLIPNFNIKTYIIDIDNKHFIYDDIHIDEGVIHLTKYEPLYQPEDLYIIKQYELGIIISPRVKLAGDNLYVVYNYNSWIDNGIWFNYRSISGEKIKKLRLPFTDRIAQITYSDKECFLLGWNSKIRTVIHINLVDYSYKRFSYPLSDLSTIDNEGRFITYQERIVNIYEQDKLASSIETDIEVTGLVAYNRILYLKHNYTYVVYYY